MIVLTRLLACCLLLTTPLAGADVLLLDGIDAGRTSAHLRPARGMSMEAVGTSFGAPTSQQNAVGDPPIARWDYPGFVVYFEYQYVIHAVSQ